VKLQSCGINLHIKKKSYRDRKKPIKMKEHDVVLYTVFHLSIEEKFTLETLSIKSRKAKNDIRKKLKNGLAITDTSFKREGADIGGHFKHGRKKINRKIIIEAKGDTVQDKINYNLYTVLGQLIFKIEKNSNYNWYAIAVPRSWMKNIKALFTVDGEIKPVIDAMIKRFIGKSGQGLWFYLVANNAKVERKTWRSIPKWRDE